MNYELHSTGFVEESLGDYGVLRGDVAQNFAARVYVSDCLFGAQAIEAAFLIEDAGGLLAACGDFFAQARNGGGQLGGAAGSFTQPERNIGSSAFRIGYANAALLDALDSPGIRAEEENAADD